MKEMYKETTDTTLALARPDLAAEWHLRKNGNLSPNDVKSSSRQKVWWLKEHYDKGLNQTFFFEWEATIYSRVKGNGCPFLASRAIWVGYNDLATRNPNLAKEWHPTKNNGLTPQDVFPTSQRMVWWQQAYYDSELNKEFIFEWPATVQSRNNGCSNPFIINKRLWPGFNDLATRNPQAAAWWHPTKNGTVTPVNVLAVSGNKAWFYQKYHDDFTGKDFEFEWEAPICSCVNNPYLTSRKVFAGFNDLATKRPDIAKEWDYERNSPLTPDKVTSKSHKKVWWCIHYHDEKTGKIIEMSWEEKISNRVNFNYGCPYLTGQAVLPGFNDLATTHPELAKQWHPTKNGKLTPNQVTYGSTRKVWWLENYFSEKHNNFFSFEWPASIAHRARGEKNPFVRGLSVWPGFNDVASNYPKLAQEWDYERNGDLMPDKVVCGSNRKVWWKISYPHPITGELMDLSWKASISHRALNGDNCPYLKGRAVFPGFNDLATTHPELAQEWHPTKNKGLKPTDVSAGSGRIVWRKAYILGKWYEWEAAVSYRAIGMYGIPELKIASAFEAKIAQILTNLNYSFEGEKTFAECKSKLALRYDFYVERQFLIEADGYQHFQTIGIFDGEEGFSKRIVNDNKKNTYAHTNKIPLLRIPYRYINDCAKIQEFISEFINTHHIPQEILDYYSRYTFSNYATLFK